MRAFIVALLAIHPSRRSCLASGGYPVTGVLFGIIYPAVRGCGWR